MPQVVNKKTGQTSIVSDATAASLVKTGQFDLGAGARVEVTGRTGGHASVDSGALASNDTLSAVTPDTQAEAARRARLEAWYSDGLRNKLTAFSEGAVRGLTAGLWNPSSEGARARQEFDPGLETVGDIAGMIVPVIATGGAAAPEEIEALALRGAVEAGGELTARGLARGAGEAATSALRYTPAALIGRGGAAISEAAGGGIRGAAAAGAFEGAAQNAGSYLGQVATGDKDLSAEGFLGSVGSGGLYGGIGGGAFGAAESGFVRAREMFPKLAGRAGRQTAEAAEEAFGRESTRALKAGDDLFDKAKARLTELKVEGAEVDVATRKKVADLRVAEAEQKLATRRAKDELAIARAKKGKPLRSVDIPVDDLGGMPTTTMPKGFGRGVHVAEEAPIYKGVPSPGEIDESAIYVAHPRDFADRVEFPMGTSGDATRLEKVRRGLSEGKELPPIEVTMRRDGTMEIADGRHRLTAAAQLDQPVAIRFSKAYEPDEAIASHVADEMVTEATDAARAAAPTAEAQRIQQAMGDYAERRAAVDEWLAKTRKTGAGGKAGIHEAPSNVGHWTDSGWVSGEEHAFTGKNSVFHDAEGNRITEAEYHAQRPDELVARDRPRPGTVEDQVEVYQDYNTLVRKAAMESEGEARDALLKEAADLEMQAFDAGPADQRIRVMKARERLGLDAEAMARKRMEREVENISKMRPEDAVYHVYGEGTPSAEIRGPKPLSKKTHLERDDAARFSKALREQELPSIIGGRPRGDGSVDVDVSDLGNTDRLVNDVDRGARVIDDYERAHAELADALGDAAPPEARQIADEYKGAVAEAEQKATKRHAQVADDVATEPAPSASKRGGLMGHLADIGSVMEVLHTLGVPGIPDLRTLPVIGPILSLYLKTRAARAVFSRLGGKVPASVEAKVAKGAAATRDKVATSVDRLLAGGARAAAAARPVAGSLAVLGKQLYDDGVHRSAPKDPPEAARQRAEELAAATVNPDATKQAIRRALRGAADPDLVDAIAEAQLRKLSYLATHAPKAPPPSLLGGHDWRPSKVEAERFARRVRAAEDPAGVLEDALHGVITPEAADTLRTVYPRLYQEAQERLLERAPELDAKLPIASVARLSILFDAPLAPAFQPDSLAAIQAAHGKSIAQPPPPEQPGAVGGPPMQPGPAPDLSNLYMTRADQSALR